MLKKIIILLLLVSLNNICISKNLTPAPIETSKPSLDEVIILANSINSNKSKPYIQIAEEIGEMLAHSNLKLMTLASTNGTLGAFFAGAIKNQGKAEAFIPQNVSFNSNLTEHINTQLVSFKKAYPSVRLTTLYLSKRV